MAKSKYSAGSGDLVAGDDTGLTIEQVTASMVLGP
jgi:hypothetical protein